MTTSTRTSSNRAVELRERMAQAVDLHSALSLLDARGRGDAAADVLATAIRIDAIRGTRWRCIETNRAHVAATRQRYYADGFNEHRLVSASLPDGTAHLTVLSSPDWLDRLWDMMAVDGAGNRFTYEHHADEPAQLTSAVWRRAAETRLAECLVDQTRFADGRLYRMTGLHPTPSGVGASFTLGSFVKYALASDLLESETIAAVQRGGPPRLPLRDQLMPTVSDVLDPGSRDRNPLNVGISTFSSSCHNDSTSTRRSHGRHTGDGDLAVAHQLMVRARSCQ